MNEDRFEKWSLENLKHFIVGLIIIDIVFLIWWIFISGLIWVIWQW